MQQHCSDQFRLGILTGRKSSPRIVLTNCLEYVDLITMPNDTHTQPKHAYTSVFYTKNEDPIVIPIVQIHVP